jgi:anti-sigma-K factor RskA
MRDHQQFADDLVLYALHELPASDAAEFHEHLKQCAGCRRELEEINSQLAVLALSSVASAPPQRSRERLMRAIKTEPQRVRRVIMHRPWWSFVPTFAAALLALFGLMLWRENTSLRNRLEATQQRLEQQQGDLDRARLVLDALTSPESAHFALVSTKDQPVPEGKASYMRKTGTVVFTAQHLAPLPPEKTYQLWLVPVSGTKPMPCGTFKPDINGNAAMVMPYAKKDAWPKMFAVTIEAEGGSETPTMPLVMAGS